jgi:hypothetical protein
MRKYTKLPVKGIRKLECTYNQVADTYHPHFHLVVEGTAAAGILVDLWLEAFPAASRKAQDVRPADEGSMIELFKYTTKIVTRHDKEVKGDVTTFKICAKALDVIFQALMYKRAFQPMGINKVVSEDVDDIQTEEFPQLRFATQVWEFVHDLGDYVSQEGELMTGSKAKDHYKVLRR